MSSTLHEILWEGKAEGPSSGQQQDSEDVRLKQEQIQEEDAS